MKKALDIVGSLIPHSEVENVTPEVAMSYLQRNASRQRRLRPGRVKEWEEAIQKGRWQLTHQGIAFDTDGELIDGQHRLTAIVNTGIAVPMMVTRGLPKTSFDVIDQGAFRSASDILGLSQRHVASLRVLLSLENKDVSGNHVKTADLEERFSEGLSPDVWHIISIAPRLQSPIIGALAYARPLDTDKIDAFAIQVMSGEHLGATDPAYRLREYLSRRRSTSKSSMWVMAMVALNTVRHHLNDTKLSATYTGDGGYRAISTRRRALNIPHTPRPGEVPTLTL